MFQKLMSRKRLGKKGFTLIELIIVIAIIGILAAILIPQFSGFRQGAVDRAAIALGRNLGTAHAALLADNKTIDASGLNIVQYMMGDSATLASLNNTANNVTATLSDVSASGFTLAYTQGALSATVTYTVASGVVLSTT